MRFTELPLSGAWLIDLERHEDDRGFFARTFCRREFQERGLDPNVAQTSISVNHRLHTLRGIHYQDTPHQEAKVVRCVSGVIYDVIVDLRRTSRTYRHWYATALSSAMMNALYIPPDFGHAFLTLTDGATVFYQMSNEHQPEFARGLRWNDPALEITWPAVPQVISERDASYPLLSEADHG